ncbi:MAG: hypothetical protein V3V22_07705 [Methylococcales bacterium]
MKLLKAIQQLTWLTMCIAWLSGCADWQTTPTTVDENHGFAVRQMISNQTLYPEHSQSLKQVTVMDGSKGQQIIRAYRAPATDLRQGKEGVDFNAGVGKE